MVSYDSAVEVTDRKGKGALNYGMIVYRAIDKASMLKSDVDRREKLTVERYKDGVNAIEILGWAKIKHIKYDEAKKELETSEDIKTDIERYDEKFKLLMTFLDKANLFPADTITMEDDVNVKG